MDIGTPVAFRVSDTLEVPGVVQAIHSGSGTATADIVTFEGDGPSLNLHINVVEGSDIGDFRRTG